MNGAGKELIRQKEYWNGVANEKNFTTPFCHNLYSEYVSKEAVILDYGCGYGRTLSELKEHGYHNLYGVDFSKEIIKRAQINSGNIKYNVINSGLLPFADNSFDSALIFAVLTCVYTDQEQDKHSKRNKKSFKA